MTTTNTILLSLILFGAVVQTFVAIAKIRRGTGEVSFILVSLFWSAFYALSYLLK